MDIYTCHHVQAHWHPMLHFQQGMRQHLGKVVPAFLPGRQQVKGLVRTITCEVSNLLQLLLSLVKQ